MVNVTSFNCHVLYSRIVLLYTHLLHIDITLHTTTTRFYQPRLWQHVCVSILACIDNTERDLLRLTTCALTRVMVGRLPASCGVLGFMRDYTRRDAPMGDAPGGRRAV